MVKKLTTLVFQKEYKNASIHLSDGMAIDLENLVLRIIDESRIKTFNVGINCPALFDKKEYEFQINIKGFKCTVPKSFFKRKKK
jgi:hypothetical protein